MQREGLFALVVCFALQFECLLEHLPSRLAVALFLFHQCHLVGDDAHCTVVASLPVVCPARLEHCFGEGEVARMPRGPPEEELLDGQGLMIAPVGGLVDLLPQCLDMLRCFVCRHRRCG